MLGISAWSKYASGVDTNLFVALAYLHCFAVPLFSLLFFLVVLIKSTNPVAGLALGVYIILTGLALASIALLWAGSDNSFIFLPFEGGLTALAGLQLIVVSTVRIVRRRIPYAPILRGIAFALAGALFIILWLFWRGPGDWSATTPDVRLFSFPAIVAAAIIAWQIYKFAL